MVEHRAPESAPDLEADTPAPPSVPYSNVLSFSPMALTVPYEASDHPRPDGGVNHGFKDLKRHPELLGAVPELASDPALRSIMAAIGRPATGLFSIACESKTIVDERGCRLRGYVEFALNCRQRVTDAAHYFRLYHEFDRRLRQEGFAEPVSFRWEICPMRFVEVGVDGFAADVRVDTDYHAATQAAYECWTRSLVPLERLLGGIPAQGDAIYVRDS